MNINYYLKNWDFKSKNIVIFGLGEKFKNYYNELKEDIVIKYIIDSNIEKINTFFDGIPVISLDDYMNMKEKYMILISTHFESISSQLIEKGFENNDFFDLYKFVQIWHWINEKKIYMFQGCLAITTKCTLKCKDCAMFIPEYIEGKHRNFTDIKDDLDSLFRVIDKIYVLELLGGEPFLNIQLEEIIDYIGSKYINKIGKVVIFTNGTVIPESKIIEKMKKCKKIEVFISDYTEQVNYSKKINVIKDILTNNKIKFKISKRKWFDLGVVNQNLDYVDDYNKHMMNCDVTSKGIYNGRIYYCHILWSAVQCRLIEEKKDDYLELNNVITDDDKIKFMEYTWGLMKNECLSLCYKCNGFGGDNRRIISQGIQFKEK